MSDRTFPLHLKKRSHFPTPSQEAIASGRVKVNLGCDRLLELESSNYALQTTGFSVAFVMYRRIKSKSLRISRSCFTEVFEEAIALSSC
jgi:hypothetical protein